LIRLAASLMTPTSGRLTWGGKPHTDGKRIAVMFQRPVMLRRSAAANVSYGLSRQAADARAQHVTALLAQVGLAHLGARPARRLSGGEQQRLALARALALEPEVLFLDEPAANLDPASTLAIEGLIQRARDERVKIVLVTHDFGQARRLGDEIVFLHKGRVEEQAAAARFFTAPASAKAEAFLAGRIVL
jgi:tungstate transport system ATP-binding protein